MPSWAASRSPAWRQGRSRRHRPQAGRGHLARPDQEGTLRSGRPRHASGRLTTHLWDRAAGSLPPTLSFSQKAIVRVSCRALTHLESTEPSSVDLMATSTATSNASGGFRDIGWNQCPRAARRRSGRPGVGGYAGPGAGGEVTMSTYGVALEQRMTELSHRDLDELVERSGASRAEPGRIDCASWAKTTRSVIPRAT